MRLPFPVVSGLGPEARERWQHQFVAVGRERSEGLWRRTQSERTMRLSGWRGPSDARRKMIYFSDRYAVVPHEGSWSLMLTEPFLWCHWLAPAAEISGAFERLLGACATHGWRADGAGCWRLGDLVLRPTVMGSHPEDLKAGRRFPPDYRVLEFTLSGERSAVGGDQLHRPWEVLATGVREPGRRGNPRVVTDLAALDFHEVFPAQFEIGSGASIEAGIPPLKLLHGIYHVIDECTGEFVLRPHLDPLIPELAASPQRFYEAASVVYRRSLVAEPSPFYQLLPRLADRGLLVGEVITNNFDGLATLVGLRERYVRRYEEEHIVPKIAFDPRAKSLFVVGSHADRRLTQQAARAAGLTVVFVDPESFREGGIVTAYPLESVQDNDILVRMTADEFARALTGMLAGTGPKPS